MESTSLSDEELTFYSDLFALFDYDGNETVDPEELGNVLRYIGNNPTNAEIDAIRKEADEKVNSSGKLEFFEFCDVIIAHRKSLEEEENELKAAFQVFDRRGNGTVNRSDLKEALLNVGMVESEVDNVFATVDFDENGFINCAEFVGMILGS